MDNIFLLGDFQRYTFFEGMIEQKKKKNLEKKKVDESNYFGLYELTKERKKQFNQNFFMK